MVGPLDGLLVVEAGWGMPSGIASLLLADYGATVVKVERPGGGPDHDSMLRRSLDRGKYSVQIDLQADADRDRLRRLATAADVFIDASGRGRLAGLGLGYEDMRADNPRLVHLSLTGYGLDSPWSDRPGYDALVAARWGLMAEQQGHRPGPIFLGHPSVSYVTGFLSAIGVLTALRARALTGRGQQVDASLFDGMLAVNTMNWWWNERDLSYLARSGTDTGFGRSRLVTDLFECADGQYLMMHTGGEGGFKRAMDILGFGDRIQPVDGLEMSVPLNDEEYDIARRQLPARFLTRTRQEWLDTFHAADLAALPVLRPHEALQDEQVVHADLGIELEDDIHGRIRQVGPVMRFEKSSVPDPRRAPRVGEHDGQLEELVASTTPHDHRRPPTTQEDLPHPLEGLRVLDLSSFFATAYGARLLSDLGADVIKIEPVNGDQMRPLPDLFEGAQRGKRTIAVDLQTDRGRDILHRLVATSDIVMHNLRPGKAEKLGFGYEELREIKPDLVYCYLPGFGSTGPKSGLKSFAPLVSGFAGPLYEGAGQDNPPVRRVLGNEDLYNGLSGAVAALMALLHRHNTGEGQYVESPQLHSSLFVVSEHSTTVEGDPLPAHTLDQDQTGWSALYRIYQTSDGWICLACIGDRAFRRLAEAVPGMGLESEDFASHALRRQRQPELAALLTEAFASMTADEACSRLEAHGVPVEIVAEDPVMPELLWDEWALQTDRVFEHHHPEHGWIREIGLVVRLLETPGVKKGTSPLLGEHSVALLQELSYSDDDIEALVETGVVVAPVTLGA